MSRQNKIPRFLYDWRAAIIMWPAIIFYCGLLPFLKAIGSINISWFWTLAPVWLPIAAYWYLVGMTAFVVLFVELGFEIMPDEEYKGAEQSIQPESADKK